MPEQFVGVGFYDQTLQENSAFKLFPAVFLFFDDLFKVILFKKQARKSSEDTHFTGYARFEKVWAR